MLSTHENIFDLGRGVEKEVRPLAVYDQSSMHSVVYEQLLYI